jgi:hypothetical protein
MHINNGYPILFNGSFLLRNKVKFETFSLVLCPYVISRLRPPGESSRDPATSNARVEQY